MTSGIEGGVALIVGATSGIGRATAEAFARDGASVMLAGRNKSVGDDAVQAIVSKGGNAAFVAIDVRKPDSVEAAVEAAVSTFGRLDFAFNNAGWEGTMEKAGDISVENWDRMIETKLRGVWLGMKHQLTAMLEHKRGAIVNMAGSWGLVGFPNFASYCAAAHGIMGLTKAASLEYARDGIRINAVCPGAVKAPLLDRMTGGAADVEAGFAAQTAMGRLATPDEVADAVVWLCSDRSSYVNGHGLVLNGGGNS